MFWRVRRALIPVDNCFQKSRMETKLGCRSPGPETLAPQFDTL